MGFSDLEVAYRLELPPVPGANHLALRSVLNVVAAATDKGTHQTFISHAKIAERSGASKKTVARALDVLQDLGLIRREKQWRPNGGRSTDLITFDAAASPHGRGDDAPVVTTTIPPIVTEGTPPPPGGHAPSSPRLAPPSHPDRGNRIRPKNPSSDPSSDPNTLEVIVPAAVVLMDSGGFDEFWSAWPKKRAKPEARRAWGAATKRAKPAVIIAAAIAYRDNPHCPESRFIPNPATWLRGDRWNDELDGPSGLTRGQEHLAYIASLGNGRPTRDDENMAVVARLQQQESAGTTSSVFETGLLGGGNSRSRTAQNLAVVAELAAREEAARRHEEIGPGTW